MNAALRLVDTPAPATQDADAHCFHCGEPNLGGTTFQVEFDGRMRQLCCAGCAAVAQTIIDAGLGEFYRKRAQTAAEPGELLPDIIRDLARYELPALQSEFSHSGHGGTREAELILDGLTCPACAWLVERTLMRTPGVTAATVNYATERAHVTWLPHQTRLADILLNVQRVGLRARPLGHARHGADAARERKRRLLELLIAGLGMMQVMMYAVPAWFAEPGDITVNEIALLHWASLALTLPVVLYGARSFFRNAWRDLRHGAIGMDVPIALAIAATFAASVWATVSGSGEVYFDSVSMFVFLLLGARFVEYEARQRALRAMEGLGSPLPQSAQRLPRYPDTAHTEAVAVAALAAGDVVRVASGATVPGDGTVLEGTSALDEAFLTGESLPVRRGRGERVCAGSINIDTPLIVRLDRVGATTTLQQISRLARHALAAKPRLVRTTDRLASLIALGILGLAAITALYWAAPGSDAWFRHAVAVLVVTCPCALALAVPAALAAQSGAAARDGMLIARSRALEGLAGITDVVFDKTGTLTEANIRLADTTSLGTVDAPHCLRLAAALEAGSSHPVARALIAAAEAGGLPACSAQNLSSSAGLGVEGTIDGVRYRLGTAGFVGEILAVPLPAHDSSAAPGTTRVYLGCVAPVGAQWLARFTIAAPLRTSAAAAITALRHAGLNLHLASGDLPDAVDDVATRLGIPAQVAQATPQRKLDYVARLQSQGCRVLMVGDGINDAPVLARADVSIAIASGGGTDLARAHADVVMVTGDLVHIPALLAAARQTRRVIRQNLAWALAYNLLSVPLAMAGFIVPWVAALGMSASSLFVVCNAARLLNTPRRRAARAA